MSEIGWVITVDTTCGTGRVMRICDESVTRSLAEDDRFSFYRGSSSRQKRFPKGVNFFSQLKLKRYVVATYFSPYRFFYFGLLSDILGPIFSFYLLVYFYRRKGR